MITNFAIFIFFLIVICDIFKAFALFRALVSSEDVPGIDFFLHIIEAFIVSVGDDRLTLLLEILQIVYHAAAEEGGSALQRRFVDDNLGALCLDALHHALDAALAEIVAVALHREAIHADGARLLFLLAVVVLVGVIVVACHVEHSVGDEILAGAVALYDGLDQILGHVGIV